MLPAMSMLAGPGREPEADSLEVRAIAVERLTFFADAVIAIAITLLALELPVPEGSTNSELLHSIREHGHEYVAFLISFIVVGAHWAGHHRVFRYVTAMTGRLSRVTIYWLLMQVVTPFATKVLTGDGAFQVRFILYAAVQTVGGVLFLVMIRLVREGGVLRDDTPPGAMRAASIRTAVMAGAFGISMPVSFVSRPAAYGCWIVIPLVGTRLVMLLRRRTQPGPEKRAL